MTTEKGGRPLAEINLRTLEAAAAIGCTDAEMAAVCGVAESTLKDRRAKDPDIQAAVDRGRATGRATLRRAQWHGAMSGNATMQIWLGKQMLGQKDKLELSGDQDAPIATRDAGDPKENEKAYREMLGDG